MIKLEGEAAEIIDHITERLETLNQVEKRVKDLGKRDQVLEGKILALENLREWITVMYF